MSDARAHQDVAEGEDRIVISINQTDVLFLNQIEAERLLYDLHGIITTLRGVNKPYSWRIRGQRVFAALTGH